MISIRYQLEVIGDDECKFSFWYIEVSAYMYTILFTYVADYLNLNNFEIKLALKVVRIT